MKILTIINKCGRKVTVEREHWLSLIKKEGAEIYIPEEVIKEEPIKEEVTITVKAKPAKKK